MDDNEVFVPTEESIKDIVRNEVLHATATTKPPDGNRKVSLVGKKPACGGKRSGKQRQSHSANRKGQRSRSKSAKRSNQPRSSSKNARGKGSGHVK